MSYATVADLEAAFGAAEIEQLLGADRTADAVLARADSAIDGYLAGRYATPLTAPPPVIVATACDLARYWLFDDAAPERVRQAYTDAVTWLKDVAAGKFVLALSLAAAETVAVGAPDFAAPDRVFDADTLVDY